MTHHRPDDNASVPRGGPRERADLSALIASRICHDLVNPLGAIGNGVELLALTGAEPSPEMDLIAESVASATARIRYFRLAYGAVAAGQTIGRAEVTATLSAAARGGRVSCDWEPAGDQPRVEVQAVFLLLQCFETALAHGGHVVVRRDGAAWDVTGEGPRMMVDEALWTSLQSARARPPASASLVQFALLPAALARIGRPLALKLDAGRVAARF